MANEALVTRRKNLGLTQDQVARQVHDRINELRRRQLSSSTPVRQSAFDANAMSRLERGEVTWPGRDVRDALCYVLCVAAPGELGLFSKRAQTPTIDRGVVSSLRRTFLAGSLSGLMPVPALGPVPDRLGADDLTAIESRIHALSALDRLSGGAAARYFAVNELNAVLGLTSASMSPGVRSQLCTLIAELANLTGWSHFDAGLGTYSRLAFNLGIQAAKEAGAADALCHLATNLARQEIQERHPERAIPLADMAGSRGLSPAALAMVEAVKAQAYALQGDEGQVLRRMSDAEAIFSRSTETHSGPRWTWSITPEKLNSDTGYAMFLMATTTGRHAPELVKTLRAAEANTDLSRARVKAMVSTRLATALFLQGSREEAAQFAAQARGLAATVDSARLNIALREMAAASVPG